MKKLLFTTIVIVGFAIATAFPPSMKLFSDTYKLKKDSKLVSSACAVCHTGTKGGKLNPYGKDIQLEMKKAKTKKMTSTILKKVDTKDSDKDGCINLCEIVNGTMPGKKDVKKTD